MAELSQDEIYELAYGEHSVYDEEDGLFRREEGRVVYHRPGNSFYRMIGHGPGLGLGFEFIRARPITRWVRAEITSLDEHNRRKWQELDQMAVNYSVTVSKDAK